MRILGLPSYCLTAHDPCYTITDETLTELHCLYLNSITTCPEKVEKTNRLMSFVTKISFSSRGSNHLPVSQILEPSSLPLRARS